MNEIKFKSGTTVKDKTVNDGDIVMINNTMGSANSDSADDKLGSISLVNSADMAWLDFSYEAINAAYNVLINNK